MENELAKLNWTHNHSHVSFLSDTLTKVLTPSNNYNISFNKIYIILMSIQCLIINVIIMV